MGKTAQLPLSEDSFGMALAYTIDGNRPPGEPLRHTDSSASVIASVPCGHTMFHASLGLTRSGESACIGAGARYAIEAEKLWVDSKRTAAVGEKYAAAQVIAGLAQPGSDGPALANR